MNLINTVNDDIRLLSWSNLLETGKSLLCRKIRLQTGLERCKTICCLNIHSLVLFEQGNKGVVWSTFVKQIPCIILSLFFHDSQTSMCLSVYIFINEL